MLLQRVIELSSVQSNHLFCAQVSGKQVWGEFDVSWSLCLLVRNQFLPAIIQKLCLLVGNEAIRNIGHLHRFGGPRFAAPSVLVFFCKIELLPWCIIILPPAWFLWDRGEPALISADVFQIDRFAHILDFVGLELLRSYLTVKVDSGRVLPIVRARELVTFDPRHVIESYQGNVDILCCGLEVGNPRLLHGVA